MERQWISTSCQEHQGKRKKMICVELLILLYEAGARADLGCGFQHRPGACCSGPTNSNGRRDAARTRRRGRLRYNRRTPTKESMSFFRGSMARCGRVEMERAPGELRGRTIAHVARPSSAAGSSTVPVRVDLVHQTATGGGTPPEPAGEDAYATTLRPHV